VSNSYHIAKNASEKEKLLSLADVIGILHDGKWKIKVITSIFTLVSVAYVFMATPIYQATALVQVEKDAGKSIFSQLSDAIPGGKQESEPQIGLLQSRMVLGQTVDDLHLDTAVQEKHFPVIGKAIANLLGTRNGTINVENFTVPEDFLDIPLPLTLTSAHTYQIEIDGTAYTGSIGEPFSQNGISFVIREIHADEGTDFTLTKLDKLTAVNQLLKSFTAKDMGNDSGMLQLAYRGDDKKKTAEILRSICNNYLKQNIERKSEEAAKSLEFLKEQLPLVLNNLNKSENTLHQFRQKNDSVDLSLEAKSILETAVGIEAQITELTFKEAEISKLYTRDHPAYRTLLEQKTVLLQERDKLNGRISAMPKTQQEVLSLTRDVQAGQEVYMQLLSKQQELSINKASAIGSVRIIDHALTEKKPVAPVKPLIVFISFMLGLFASVTYCIFRKLLHTGIENSEQIENLGVNVYATIPVSKWLSSKNQTIIRSKREHMRSVHLLARDKPSDLAVEALRSLRTSLHFAMMQSKNNILLISGATPEAGKTFVSCNLATVIAQSGKRVLLIDADLRKGQMHHVLGSEINHGVSEILHRTSEYEKVTQKTDIENLDFISRGHIPPNPSELLMTEAYADLMVWAQHNYDLVIVDTPPVLAVSDACVAAKYAGTVMLVTRFQKNSIKEVEISVKRFVQNDITVNGVILNGVEKTASNAYEYNAYSYS
jgi:tyrosine-protein kinase Etk/Wzc